VERGKMTDQQQGVLNPLGVNCLGNLLEAVPSFLCSNHGYRKSGIK